MTPSWGEEIISTKPRWKRVFVCIFLFWFVYVAMCPPPVHTQYIFHTRYSLFVLKVPLNTNKKKTIFWIKMGPRFAPGICDVADGPTEAPFRNKALQGGSNNNRELRLGWNDSRIAIFENCRKTSTVRNDAWARYKCNIENQHNMIFFAAHRQNISECYKPIYVSDMFEQTTSGWTSMKYPGRTAKRNDILEAIQ